MRLLLFFCLPGTGQSQENPCTKDSDLIYTCIYRVCPWKSLSHSLPGFLWPGCQGVHALDLLPVSPTAATFSLSGYPSTLRFLLVSLHLSFTLSLGVSDSSIFLSHLVYVSLCLPGLCLSQSLPVFLCISVSLNFSSFDTAPLSIKYLEVLNFFIRELKPLF